MASFQATRFPGPMFNQNVFRSNFNVNPIGDRHPGPSFQRPPNVNVPYRPIQPPERFIHGNFQNRPQFSNFPEAATGTFRNRMPPPNQVFSLNSPPPNQMFRMDLPPPNPAFCMNTPPPNPAFCMNTPPPNQAFRMESPPSNQTFHMNSPPPMPRPRFSGNFERPFRPWNQARSFGVPKSRFSHPRAPLQPKDQSKDLPLQANKKRKQKQREFRKLKEDSTEKPFSCDTCDRAFVTQDELKDHMSQHIKCDYQDCIFEAHPKIVALHQKMQHETGYADRINKLQDDAEIQKWREERKKRFPTADNIRKRKAEQAEKEARGEVLETKEFGKFKRRREGSNDVVNNDTGRRMRGRGPRRFNNRRRNFQKHPYSKPFTSNNYDSESDSDSDSHITLKQFLGLSSLTNPAHESHNQNEDVDKSSCPDAIIDTDKEKSSLQPNLPESDSDYNVSHPNKSCSSNEKTDHTSFLLNDDEIQECKTSKPVDIQSEKDVIEDLASLANESVCKIPANEADSAKPDVVDLQDIVSPADESVYEIPANEISLMEPEVVDLANESVYESPANESVYEIPANEISLLEPEVIDLDSDNEGPVSIQIIKSAEKSAIENDSEDEGPEIVAIQKSEEKNINNGSKSFQTREIGHQNINESKKVSSLNIKDNSNRGLKRDHVNQSRLPNRQNQVFQARKSTILEKLLADDIRHERNVVLQCIRHIVNNKFFGIGCKK